MSHKGVAFASDDGGFRSRRLRKGGGDDDDDDDDDNRPSDDGGDDDDDRYFERITGAVEPHPLKRDQDAVIVSGNDRDVFYGFTETIHAAFTYSFYVRRVGRAGVASGNRPRQTYTISDGRRIRFIQTDRYSIRYRPRPINTSTCTFILTSIFDSSVPGVTSKASLDVDAIDDLVTDRVRQLPPDIEDDDDDRFPEILSPHQALQINADRGDVPALTPDVVSRDLRRPPWARITFGLGVGPLDSQRRFLAYHALRMALPDRRRRERFEKHSLVRRFFFYHLYDPLIDLFPMSSVLALHDQDLLRAYRYATGTDLAGHHPLTLCFRGASGIVCRSVADGRGAEWTLPEIRDRGAGYRRLVERLKRRHRRRPDFDQYAKALELSSEDDMCLRVYESLRRDHGTDNHQYTPMSTLVDTFCPPHVPQIRRSEAYNRQMKAESDRHRRDFDAALTRLVDTYRVVYVDSAHTQRRSSFRVYLRHVYEGEIKMVSALRQILENARRVQERYPGPQSPGDDPSELAASIESGDIFRTHRSTTAVAAGGGSSYWYQCEQALIRQFQLDLALVDDDGDSDRSSSSLRPPIDSNCDRCWMTYLFAEYADDGANEEVLNYLVQVSRRAAYQDLRLPAVRCDRCTDHQALKKYQRPYAPCSEQLTFLEVLRRVPIVLLDGMGGAGKSDVIARLCSAHEPEELVYLTFQTANAAEARVSITERSYSIDWLLTKHAHNCTDSPLFQPYRHATLAKLKKEAEVAAAESAADPASIRKRQRRLDTAFECAQGLTHRCPSMSHRGTFRYGRCILERLRLVVIDEISMVSHQKLLRLLMALAQCARSLTRIVLVGDEGQLPPMRAGHPQKSFMSGVANQTVVRFRHCHRAQNKELVRNALAIRENRLDDVTWGRCYEQITLQSRISDDYFRSSAARRESIGQIFREIAERQQQRSGVDGRRPAIGGIESCQIAARTNVIRIEGSKYLQMHEQKTNPRDGFSIDQKIVYKTTNYRLGLTNNTVMFIEGIEDGVLETSSSSSSSSYRGRRGGSGDDDDDDSISTDPRDDDLNVIENFKCLDRSRQRTGQLMSTDVLNRPYAVRRLRCRIAGTDEIRYIPWTRRHRLYVKRGAVVTCRACQGMGYDTIVITLPYYSKYDTREMLYMLVTRARHNVVMVLGRGVLDRIMRNTEPIRLSAMDARLSRLFRDYLDVFPSAKAIQKRPPAFIVDQQRAEGRKYDIHHRDGGSDDSDDDDYSNSGSSSSSSSSSAASSSSSSAASSSSASAAPPKESMADFMALWNKTQQRTNRARLQRYG